MIIDYQSCCLIQLFFFIFEKLTLATHKVHGTLEVKNLFKVFKSIDLMFEIFSNFKFFN